MVSPVRAGRPGGGRRYLEQPLGRAEKSRSLSRLLPGLRHPSQPDQRKGHGGLIASRVRAVQALGKQRRRLRRVPAAQQHEPQVRQQQG